MATVGKETQRIICGGKYDMEPIRGRPVPVAARPKNKKGTR